MPGGTKGHRHGTARRPLVHSPLSPGALPLIFPPSSPAIVHNRSAPPESPPMPDFPQLRAERAELEQSIEARQRELGPDHPDLANDLRALGRLAHELGDFIDAQALLHRALALHTESMGAEHPETATTINHIGLVLHDLGDLDAAAAAFERALALDEQALGREHVNVARDCNNLGGVLRDMGDRFAAKAALDWALSVYMAQLGPDHPTTKSVKRNRALVG
jgi:Flp pilus assembly protein TadD